MNASLQAQTIRSPLNYSTALKAAGIVLLFQGAYTANTMVFRAAAQFIPEALVEPMPQFVAGPWTVPTIIYRVLMVIFLGATGYGSIRAFRWTPRLTVATAWLCFLGGILLIPLMAAALEPSMFSGNRHPDRDFTLATFYVLQLFFCCVILPIPMILFYNSRAINGACTSGHPRWRWIDRCPPAVLLQCMLGLFFPITLINFAFAGQSVPFLGHEVQGAPAVTIGIMGAMIGVWLAWETCHLRARAWWGTFIFTVFIGFAIGDTFYRAGLLDLVQGTIARGHLAQAGAAAVDSTLHFGRFPVLTLYLLLLVRNYRHFAPVSRV